MPSLSVWYQIAQRIKVVQLMAVVSNKGMYDSKILEAINHIKNISKKKPTVDNIHKYLVNHDLDLEKELLQVFLDNLQEEDNVEIYGSRNKEKCYNVMVSANKTPVLLQVKKI